MKTTYPPRPTAGPPPRHPGLDRLTDHLDGTLRSEQLLRYARAETLRWAAEQLAAPGGPHHNEVAAAQLIRWAGAVETGRIDPTPSGWYDPPDPQLHDQRTPCCTEDSR